MTPITKQQVEELIDRLADRSLTFAQRVEMPDGLTGRFIGASAAANWMIYHNPSMKVWSRKPDKNAVIKGHPILIGDVLAKLEKAEKTQYFTELISLWHYAGGITKSLQSILSEAEWEEGEFEARACKAIGGIGATVGGYPQVPRQPHIRELFEFLIKLGL